jgi:hypothetical protein
MRSELTRRAGQHEVRAPALAGNAERLHSGDDLLLLAKLLDQAHSWIMANPARQAA